GMSPKIGAMTIQVFQDQVDGLARVFGPPALGALPAQRSLEALERRSDLVELLRRGVFLFEPENRAQTVKQIGAFGKSLQKQEERRLVLFKRAQHALESFQRFEDLGVGRRCAKESSEGGQEMQAAGGSHRVVDGVLLLASPCRYRRENADDRPARESASSGIAHIGQRPRSSLGPGRAGWRRGRRTRRRRAGCRAE